MTDDLLAQIGLLDPIDAADADEDARTMAEVVDARIEAVPAPPASSRFLRSRRVHALLAACVAIALLAIALVSLGRPDTTPADPTVDGWIVVGTLQDLRSAVITYVEGANAFVIAREGEDPYALSAVSPHSTYGFEEPLLYCRPAGQFEEPTHGSAFDVHGRYLLGPSPTGMYGVPLRMSGSSVEINPASMLPAPSRAEHGDPFKLCPPRATWSEPGFMDVGGSGNSLFDQTFFHAPGADATTGTFVSTVRGSNCSFPIPTFLQLTEPLGSMPANDYEDWLYYVADPVGVWTDLESSTFGEGEPLPRSVAFTGYRSHLFELWADPAKIDTEVWIVRNDPNGGRLVQRWPRVEQFPACSPPEGPAAGLSSASEGPTSAEQPPIVSSSIRAANLSFDTDTLALQADTRTTLTLENTDRGVPHSIMIRATDGVELFSGGLITGPSSIDYDIPPLAGGTYVFQCAVHPTMKGTVVVTTG